MKKRTHKYLRASGRALDWRHEDRGVRRLSRYLAIATILIAIVPITLFYMVLNQVASDTISATLEQELEEKAYLVRRTIDRYYEQRKDELRSLSQADVLEGDDLDAIEQYIEEITEYSPNFIDIELSGVDGEVLSNAEFDDEQGESIYELYPSFNRLIKQAYNASQGEVFLSPLIELDDGSEGYIMLTPVTDDSNTQVIKLLSVELSLARIQAIFDEVSAAFNYQNHVISLVNEVGKPIVSTQRSYLDQAVLPELSGNLASLSVALSSDAESLSYVSNNYVLGLSTLDELGIAGYLRLSVLVSMPHEQAIASITKLKQTSYGLSLGVSIFAFVLMLWATRRAMKTVHQKANYDAVTELPNRRLFIERFKKRIKVSKQQGSQCALFYIDLDRFKEVNDSLGHSAGDLLLCEVARRLTSIFSRADTVARIGGDEFAVIIRKVDNQAELDALASAVIESINVPFELHGRLVYISTSIGIAQYPRDADSVEILMQSADQALFHAKAEGKGQFAHFNDEMKCALQRQHQLSQDLRHAIEKSELELYLQPIVNLANQKQLTKAEALLRWKHPSFGFVSPMEFIPIAEESQLICDLGDWIFIEALKAIKTARLCYGIDLTISINVSPAQLRDENLLPKWRGLLKEYQVGGSSICVEITEGMLMVNLPLISRQLQQMKALGFTIALDDFGTGYSSLSYLKQIDIDVLKIDKSFVDEVQSSDFDLTLCKAVVAMARSLNIKVVAEGAESLAQVQLLEQIGSDYCQGYYFSKPLPIEVFYHYLLTSERDRRSAS